MELKKWIRIVAVVGAYLLIRPYFIKMGAKKQEQAYAKTRAEHAEKQEKEKHMGANSFRESGKISEDTDEEDAKTSSNDVKWGGKARKKQRQQIRKILDNEEKLRREQQADDEDKDIQEFLHD